MFRDCTLFDMKKDSSQMIITIHQPDFLPWLGFFDRWRKSNLYVVLDDAQFLRRGWHHRDRIKTALGIRWLTIPALKKGRYFQQIREVKIDNDKDWRSQHLGMISQAYNKAPNFNHVFEGIKKIYLHGHEFLMDLNMEFLQFAANMLGITTPIVYASTFNIKENGNQRLIELLKAVNGNTYLTGLGSKDYLDEKNFTREQIKVIWQKFNHPFYSQLYGDFIERLSVLDYLMVVKNDCVAKEWLDE